MLRVRRVVSAFLGTAEKSPKLFVKKNVILTIYSFFIVGSRSLEAAEARKFRIFGTFR